jgi:hypothetical protein
MLYWKEIIYDLAKILTKYERMPGEIFHFSSTLLCKLYVHYANGFDNT